MAPCELTPPIGKEAGSPLARSRQPIFDKLATIPLTGRLLYPPTLQPAMALPRIRENDVHLLHCFPFVAANMYDERSVPSSTLEIRNGAPGRERRCELAGVKEMKQNTSRGNEEQYLRPSGFIPRYHNSCRAKEGILHTPNHSKLLSYARCGRRLALSRPQSNPATAFVSRHGQSRRAPLSPVTCEVL